MGVQDKAKQFFPKVDAHDAASNFLVSTSAQTTKAIRWLGYKIDNNKAHLLDPLVQRALLPIPTGIWATMDSFYNGVWLSIKSVVIVGRGTIRLLTNHRHGHFAEQVTTADLRAHLYKFVIFFFSIFVAPIAVMISPSKVISLYQAHKLVTAPAQ